MGFPTNPMFNWNVLADGELDIQVRSLVIGTHSGLRILPPQYSSHVASFGIYGLTGLRYSQKVPNVMTVGDAIRTVISERHCRFKRYRDAYSLDLYRAYQEGDALSFGFSFRVKEGDYYQKALFSVAVSNIKEYNPNAKPVSGLSAPAGLELIDFEFEDGMASLEYGKELDSAFIVRVKEQQKSILKALGARKQPRRWKKFVGIPRAN